MEPVDAKTEALRRIRAFRRRWLPRLKAGDLDAGQQSQLLAELGGLADEMDALGQRAADED